MNPTYNVTYNVTVEGKGSVCLTTDLREATRIFEVYKNRSMKGIGFAAGKSVLTYRGQEIFQSYEGKENAE